MVVLQEFITSLTGLNLNRIRASYVRLYGRDVFLGPREVGSVRTVSDSSWTLQYRSDEFGATAHILRRITKDCDLGSTLRRTTIVVSM